MVVFNERHLRRVLSSYLDYCHRWRTHLALDLDCPVSRAVQPPGMGDVVEFPDAGGLHHHYERRAA